MKIKKDLLDITPSSDASVGNNDTSFIGIAESVGHSGLRVYVPRIAALNASLHSGDRCIVSIRRFEQL